MTVPSGRNGAIASWEARRQTRDRASARGRVRLVEALTYALALGFALVIGLVQLVGSLTQADTRPFMAALGGLPFVLVVLTFAAQIIVSLQLLLGGASTIAGERERRLWEPLVLTGVPARELVRGKWWGTLRAHARRLALLLPLRVGTVIYLGLTTSAVTSAAFTRYAGPTMQLVPPDPLGLLLIVPLLAAYTVAGAALTAAVGVAMSATVRRPALAAVAAVACAVAVVLLPPIACLYLSVRSGPPFDPVDPAAYERAILASEVFSTSGLIWADNGTLLSATLAYYEVRYTRTEDGANAATASMRQERDRSTVSAVAAVVLTLALYAALTWGFLRLAETRARRAGAI